MSDETATTARIARLRVRAQALHGRAFDSAIAVAGHLCGIQAQEMPAAALAIRARAAGVTSAEIERNIRAGVIVRTWCMRGTLHLLAAEDLGWLLDLLGPVAIARSRRRREQLSLDADFLERGRRQLRSLLERAGAMTRAEVGERLARAGLRLEGQALYHFLRHMALEGLIHAGPDRRGTETFVLAKGRAGHPVYPSRDAASTELARRYLTAYAPAGLDDFAAWSGLGMRDARRGWRGLAEETVDVPLGDETARVPNALADSLREDEDGRDGVVRLLPAYDPYLLGYRSRDFAVAPRYARRIHPGGGFLRPAVLVDGRIRGTWKYGHGPEGLELEIHPFDRLTRGVRSALEAEAEDLARFLDTAVAVLRVESAS